MLSSFRTGLLLAGVYFASATAGHCDVLEIGSGGAVTVYSRPGVYTYEGVRPIIAAPQSMPSTGAVHDLIRLSAQRQALSADLLEAVAWRESRFHHAALSPKGAAGVMQIMPATAAALGVDRFDLRQNIEGGAVYLRLMLNRYAGSIPLALAAYNAGPGAVDRYGGVPPYRETQAYVAAIVNRLASGAVAPSLATFKLIEP